LALTIGFAAVLPDFAGGSEPEWNGRSPRVEPALTLADAKGVTELTVEVLSFDDIVAPPRPVAGALVRIEGSDHQFTTNESGRVSFSVPTKSPTTLFFVVDGDVCTLLYLPNTAPQETIRVVVDLTDKPRLQCHLK